MTRPLNAKTMTTSKMCLSTKPFSVTCGWVGEASFGSRGTRACDTNDRYDLQRLLFPGQQLCLLSTVHFLLQLFL